MRDLCCLGLLLPPHCALSPSPHFCTETRESPGHLPRGLLPHPTGSGEGGEGKAATQGLYSPAEHEAEGFHSSAALTFAGMAARYETARVGSEASLAYRKTLLCWPEVSNNNSLPFSHGRIASAAALKLSSNPS